MKLHNHECPSCGAVLENTRTRSTLCRICADAKRLNEKFEEDKKILESQGFTDVKNPTLNKFKQRVWTFTHPSGKEETTTFNNLQTRLKKQVAS